MLALSTFTSQIHTPYLCSCAGAASLSAAIRLHREGSLPLFPATLGVEGCVSDGCPIFTVFLAVSSRLARYRPLPRYVDLCLPSAKLSCYAAASLALDLSLLPDGHKQMRASGRASTVCGYRKTN